MNQTLPFPTVRDCIENNDDIEVRLDAMESRDDCDPLHHTFWQGRLKDIPEKYRDLDVISEGWMMEAQINSLSVYAPDLMYVHPEQEEAPAIRRGRGR